MRAERHEATAVAGTHAEHVADLIHLHVVEPELAKTVGQPRAARRLAEWRRGNLRRLHLPQRKLRFLGAEAVECRAHFRRAGEPRHFLLHRGIQIGICHSWKLHPCAYLITPGHNLSTQPQSGGHSARPDSRTRQSICARF